MEKKPLVMKPAVSLVVCLVNVFLYLDCRAEIHDVLEEYKEGAAKFMGKVQVFACISERQCRWIPLEHVQQYSRQRDVGFAHLEIFSLRVVLGKT